MDSLDDGEANICLVANHEENVVTSPFSYHYLFRICKKLNKETSKLRQLVSTSRQTISSLEFENRHLLEEVKNLK